MSMLVFPRLHRLGTGLLITALLAACASGPAPNISLIPAGQIEQEASKDGLFTQPIRWKHEKPGCEGTCPTLELDSLAFPGVPKLTELVDHALATMTWIESNRPIPYDTIAGYESYFWQTAAPRDLTILTAKTPYRNRYLTVIELNSGQMITGAAHGMSATQYLNWDNARSRVLGLNDVLAAGKHDEYIAALRRAYDRWLQKNPAARDDVQGYMRMWPFQPSDNFAFSDDGLVVKYQSYEIAPFSSGQPELRIPYGELQGVLRPEYLPSA